VSGSVGNDVRARPWVGDCHWLCARCQVLERLVRSPTIPQRVAERAEDRTRLGGRRIRLRHCGAVRRVSPDRFARVARRKRGFSVRQYPNTA
jgi:hypothetical protein